jgi:chromosome partitioning protein
MTPRIIAIANQKGGIGKTTTAVNLADFLTLEGRCVLVIDADPQSNATTGFGVQPRQIEYSTYTVLHNPKRGIGYATITVQPALDLLPATLDLAAAEWELNSAVGRELLLKRALAARPLDFDYILIDTPPSFTLLTQNALAAADEILVPVSPEIYPLKGLEQLERTMATIQETVNPGLHIGGLVITMVDKRNLLSMNVQAELHKRYGRLVYETTIPQNVRLAEAPGAGKPIRLYDSKSAGAVAYARLAQEVIARAEAKV